VNTDLEHRYRRLLRLLPAGYRQAWEEDMVTTFLHSAEGRGVNRPPLGERLSVIALAVRLRLAGQYESPRGKAWHHAAYALALMLLLHQAFMATASLTQLAARVLWRPMERPLNEADVWLFALYWLLWIVAYGALVLGWIMAARTVAVFILALIVGVTVISGDFTATVLLAVAWPAVCALLLFAVPDGSRPRRGVWLSVYLASSLVLAAHAIGYGRRDWSWLWAIDVAVFWRLALLVGMVVALAVPAVRRSPGWLLAIAVVDATFIVGSMLSRYVSFSGVAFAVPPVSVVVDLFLLGLGVACAVVGMVMLRRLPRTEFEAA
jgi:hypothetical protein